MLIGSAAMVRVTIAVSCLQVTFKTTASRVSCSSFTAIFEIQNLSLFR